MLGIAEDRYEVQLKFYIHQIISTKWLWSWLYDMAIYFYRFYSLHNITVIVAGVSADPAGAPQGPMQVLVSTDWGRLWVTSG